MTTANSENRFWQQVDKTESCWLWTGSLTHNGYGRMGFRGKVHRAHRLAYELLIGGAIPDGLTLDHLCRERRCVNPAHLEAVPLRVNILRGEGGAALNVRKTRCPAGHPLDGANLRRDGSNRARRCRACKQARESTDDYRTRHAAKARERRAREEPATP